MAHMSHDKKKRGQRLRFVTLRAIGQPRVRTVANQAALKQTVKTAIRALRGENLLEKNNDEQ